MVGDGKSGTRTDGQYVKCRIHAENFFMNGVFGFVFLPTIFIKSTGYIVGCIEVLIPDENSTVLLFRVCKCHRFDNRCYEEVALCPE